MDVADGKLTCERQAEYGYDTVEIELPAVISVGDAINEPRYPSLKAIMGAKKKPLDTKATGDVGIEADRVGEAGSQHPGPRDQPAAREAGGRDHRGRGHQRDGREDRRLARRKEADLDGGHPGLRPPRRRGQLQQELARRHLRGREARRRARRRGRGAWSSATSPTTRRAGLGKYGASKVYRAKSAPEGLAQPIVDAMAKVIADNGYSLRAVRRRPARLRDRRRPDRAPRRRRDDGGHRGQGRRTASSSPSARSSRTRRSSTSATSASPGSSSAA